MDAFNRLAEQIVEHPDLADVWNRGIDDYESLEGVDRTRFNSRMHQVFRNLEDAYHQHLEGHLDPRVWRKVEATMRDINGYPGVQAWWRSRSHWFREDFAKHVNQLQQTATAPRLFREANADH